MSTYAVVILEEIVFRVNLIEHVKHGHDVLRLRLHSVEEQIRPVHANATDAIDVVANVIDDDVLLGDVCQLDEDFVTFALDFRWRSGENHANQLLRLVDPDLVVVREWKRRKEGVKIGNV